MLVPILPFVIHLTDGCNKCIVRICKRLDIGGRLRALFPNSMVLIALPRAGLVTLRQTFVRRCHLGWTAASHPLVALTPAPVLLICAKHLFVAAIGGSSGQQAQPQVPRGSRIRDNADRPWSRLRGRGGKSWHSSALGR